MLGVSPHTSSPSLPVSGELCYRRRMLLPLVRAAAVTPQPDAERASGEGGRGIGDFMRFRLGGGRGAAASGELQTAVVRYRKRLPWRIINPFLQVDLVSTIHIADKKYFDALQKELECYDCVLYELVASRNSLERKKNFTKSLKQEKRSINFSIIGFMQKQLASILSLDFQLDCMNYDEESWLHADLDLETFKQLQREKGENLFTFARYMALKSTKALVQPISFMEMENDEFWKSRLLWASRVFPMPLLGCLIISSISSPILDQADKYPELEALARLDIGTALKFLLARKLTSEFPAITAEFEENSVIIGERNKVAIEELKNAIDRGHKKIAVLYGGGHMPDLGRRLQEELNMMPSQVDWLTAWSIRIRELDSHSLPFLKRLAKLSGWPLDRYQTLALLLFSAVLALDLCFWEFFVDASVHWLSWAVSEIDRLQGSLLGLQ